MIREMKYGIAAVMLVLLMVGGAGGVTITVNARSGKCLCGNVFIEYLVSYKNIELYN